MFLQSFWHCAQLQSQNLSNLSSHNIVLEETVSSLTFQKTLLIWTTLGVYLKHNTVVFSGILNSYFSMCLVPLKHSRLLSILSYWLSLLPSDFASSFTVISCAELYVPLSAISHLSHLFLWFIPCVTIWKRPTDETCNSRSITLSGAVSTAIKVMSTLNVLCSMLFLLLLLFVQSDLNPWGGRGGYWVPLTLLSFTHVTTALHILCTVLFLPLLQFTRTDKILVTRSKNVL